MPLRLLYQSSSYSQTVLSHGVFPAIRWFGIIKLDFRVGLRDKLQFSRAAQTSGDKYRFGILLVGLFKVDLFFGNVHGVIP